MITFFLHKHHSVEWCLFYLKDMNDKELLETLINIKEYCIEHMGCRLCKCKDSEHDICKLMVSPYQWDIEEVANEINKAKGISS